MLNKKFKHNRIKPKAFKDKAYLAYMHNSGKKCLVCGSCNIELHHIKTKTMTDRADNRIVPLCPEHHRGTFSPHGFNSNEFYEAHTKEFLLEEAERFYNEYQLDN
jgi:hypothetical protein